MKALKGGIHGRDFMIKTLTQPKERGEVSPPHEISCSSCGTKYKRMMQWARNFSWTYPDAKFKEEQGDVETKAVEQGTVATE